MLIRTNLGISKRAGTARVDLGGARPPIAGFCADLTIPGEIVNFANFHTSETPKIRLFQFSSILSRHGPCGIATELSKACKIRVLGLSVYILTELHGSGARPIISMIPIKIGNHRTIDGDGDKTCKRSKHDNTAPTTANDENVT